MTFRTGDKEIRRLLILKFAIASGLIVSMTGCSAEKLGLPRTALSAVSPDGRYVALVRNHPSIDPPRQSLWVGKRDGTLQNIKQLGEDTSWSNLAVWSSDNSTVAFLVQDAQLVTVDAASKTIASEHWLTSNDDYPPAKMVKDLSLSADGRTAHFRECARNSHQDDRNKCSPPTTRTVR